ncbi:MAG: hypothetical protein ACI94C_000001, partial [Sediminicola sp.]
MKRLFFIAVFLSCLQGLNAQQVQQFSQYFLSGFTFNPAFAGTEENFNALA